MASILLPTVNVVSMSLPVGDLEVFSQSWRLLVTSAGEDVTFTLPTGAQLVVTLGAETERTITGNQHSIWVSGVTGQQLLPPLEAVTAPTGGLPL